MEMTMYHRLGQAISNPGDVVGERQKHRAGRETVTAWQHRAVVKVLEEQGVDPHASLKIGKHPLSNCGPMMFAVPEGQTCPTCGVPAGAAPSAEALADIRKMWPAYPLGYWRPDAQPVGPRQEIQPAHRPNPKLDGA